MPQLPSSPTPISPSICTDLPEGRLPAAWERVKDILEEVAYTWAPDLILAPSCNDAHQDHRTIGEVLPTVFRNQLSLSYEIPKWDGDLGRPSIYFPLTPDVAHRKVELTAQVLSVSDKPRLVGRRGLPWFGPAPRNGVPSALLGGIHLHKVRDIAVVTVANRVGATRCSFERGRGGGVWSMTPLRRPRLTSSGPAAGHHCRLPTDGSATASWRSRWPAGRCHGLPCHGAREIRGTSWRAYRGVCST